MERWPPPAIAQDGTTVTVGVELLPYSNIDSPRAGTFEETLETRIVNSTFSLRIPSRLGSGRTTIVNGIDLSVVSFTDRGPTIPDGENRPSELYDLSYQLAVAHLVRPRWLMTVVAQPSIASNFKNVSSEHFRLQGGIVFTKIASPQTQWGFGVFAMNQFGSVLPIPVFNLTRNGESARIELELPRRAAIMFRPGKTLEFGFAAQVAGNFFRLGLEDEDAPAAADPIIRYSTVTVGPKVALRVARSTNFFVTGGLAAMRRFEATDANDVELRTIDLEPSAFLRAGIEIRAGTGG